MSLYDVIAGQLTSSRGDALGQNDSLLISPPYRVSATVAAVLSPSSRLTLLPAIPGNLPLEIDSAVFIEAIWAILTPTAAQNLIGLGLSLANNVSAFKYPVGTPLATLTAGLTGPTSLFFPNIGLVAMRDYVLFNQQFGGAALAGAALQLLLEVATSASTMALSWGCRFRVVRSLNEG